MNRLGISITLIFIAVIGLNLPIWLEGEKPKNVVNTEDELVPNYQLEALSSKIFDSNGQLAHQVVAAKMEHYDLLGFVTFENPTYIIYLDNASEPWRVTSKQGTLYDDNRIQLEDSVLIQSMSENEFIKEIKTEYIEIDLNGKTLNSDQEVQLLGDDYVINSIGFNANLETQFYELSNHVKTEYRPVR